MRILGYATAISLAPGGVALAAPAVKALPDARRYLKMRSIWGSLTRVDLVQPG